VTAASRRRWTRSDSATVALLKIVLEEDWSPLAAAERLGVLVGHDHRLLLRVRTRVEQAAVDRESQVTRRALATLSAALGDAQPA